MARLHSYRPKLVSLALAWAVITSALSSGCNLAPTYRKPVTTVAPAYKELTPDQFKETDGWRTAQPKDDVIKGNWWQMFNDAELNSLEEEVNTANQNIALAEATFRAARTLVWQARSQYFPTVSTNPSASASRFSSNSGGGSVATNSSNGTTGATGTNGAGGGASRSGSSGSGSSGSGSSASGPSSSRGAGSGSTAVSGVGGRSNIVTNFSLPFDASWEPDLWGRVRNTVAVNAYQAQASAADLGNVRLMAQAECAVDYFQLRGLDAQKQLLDATVAAYQKALDLTTALFETGIDSEEDVSQARTQLETAKTQDIDVGIQRAIFEHAIAVLTGKTPSLFSLPPAQLNATPPAVPFGIPSQLLERRPDIAAAERRVASANAQVGVVRAAFYPNLSLSASAGFQGSKLSTIFTWPSRVWSIGAVVSQTLFDAGLRKAVSAQALATYDETVATYRQTVLTAFQGVEDSLSSLRILSREREQQELAVQAASHTLGLAMDRYQLGIDSYLNVITNQNTLYSNQRTVITLQTDQMVDSVQLVMALGGGWTAAQLPSPKDLSSKSPLAP